MKERGYGTNSINFYLMSLYGISSTLPLICNVGHRNVYVAVHVPYVVPRQRKHHHHRRRRKRINVQQEHSSGRHRPLMEEVDHLGKINKINDNSIYIKLLFYY